MNLKQHNDIVQKLILELEEKDKEIKQISKNLNKQIKINEENGSKNFKSPTSVQTQKIIQKRIAQLNKQHSAKVSQLNQQIKTLTIQNTQLKQRLTLKSNLQSKEKEHIVDLMKKNFDRKPGTQYDQKVAALISHYQQQMNKKNTYIQTLKRQVKSLSLNKGVQSGRMNNENKYSKSSLNDQNVDSNRSQQQYEGLQNFEQQGQQSRKVISVLKHNQQIKKLQDAVNKCEARLQQKCKQLKDIKLKYNELTKQYYRVVNEYGVTAQFSYQTSKKNLENDNKSKVNPDFNKTKKIKPSSKLSNLQESRNSKLSLAFSDDSNSNINQCIGNPLYNLLQQASNDGDASVSINFQQNFKKFNNRPKIHSNNLDQQQQQEFIQNSNIKPSADKFKTSSNLKSLSCRNSMKDDQNGQITHSDELVYQIKGILKINSQNQLIPYLTNLMAKFNDLQLNNQILQSLHSLFYKFGMGKVAKTDMIDVLQTLQQKCTKWIQSSDLLDEICIQIGAKRTKIIDKINQFKQNDKQYTQKMRNIQFLNQLNKSNKILQFISFFQLDKSQLELPEQLKNIYQQLRCVDKFLKQAKGTLNIELKDNKGIQSTLQFILRKLQTYHQWEVELQKQKQTKAVKRALKHNNFLEINKNVSLK